MTHAPLAALAFTALAVPIGPGDLHTVRSPLVYTELVGPNPSIASKRFPGLGATPTTPANSGMTAKALSVDPGKPVWGYAVPAAPSPALSRGYFALVPDTGRARGSLARRRSSGASRSEAAFLPLRSVLQLGPDDVLCLADRGPGACAGHSSRQKIILGGSFSVRLKRYS